MRKCIVVLLAMALLLPLFPGARADGVEVKPYYAIGSSDFNRLKFPNLEGHQRLVVSVADGEVSLYSETHGKDTQKMAEGLKRIMDKLPAEFRAYRSSRSVGA